MPQVLQGPLAAQAVPTAPTTTALPPSPATGSWRPQRAWLFREGQYADKGVPQADLAFLSRYADRTNAATRGGATVPLDIEHGPTEQVLPFGQLVPGSLRVEYGTPPGKAADPGHWMTGEVLIDPEVDKRLQHRGLSVYLDLDRNVVEKVAVCKAPRVAGACFTDAGQQALVVTGGELMRVGFNDTEGAESPVTASPTSSPVAATEPELTEGFVTKLRKLLGLGSPEEPAATAATPAGGEGFTTTKATPPAAQATPPSAPAEPAPAFSDPQVKAVLTHLEDDLKAARAEAAEAGKRADAALSEQRNARVAARVAEFKAAGVPPWIVDALAPVAEGVPQVTVAFSDASGQTATRQADAAGVALHVLEGMRGAVPMSRRLPADDERRDSGASFHDRATVEAGKRMAAMRAEGKSPNPAVVLDTVLTEMRSAEAGQS